MLPKTICASRDSSRSYTCAKKTLVIIAGIADCKTIIFIGKFGMLIIIASRYITPGITASFIMLAQLRNGRVCNLTGFVRFIPTTSIIKGVVILAIILNASMMNPGKRIDDGKTSPINSAVKGGVRTFLPYLLMKGYVEYKF
ncbi:MAG: hypothetical protein M1381_09165 [Deltaproteobacteria bacterium]|nr:hypothetical protein [Deltaproteobacteria bacterium]